MSVAEGHVAIHPGGGLVARFGDCLVLVLAQDDDQQAAVPEILNAIREVGAGGEASGSDLVRRLAGILVDRPAEQQPSLGAVATAQEGVAVFAKGSVDIELQGTAGPRHLSGKDAATWVDRIVPADFDAAVIGPSGAAGAPAQGTSLGAGVVPGSGATLDLSGDARDTLEPDEAAESPPTAPQPVVVEEDVPVPGTEAPQEPEPSADFVPIALDQPPEEERAPLPLVEAPPAPEEEEGPVVKGVLCSRDHFNDPNSLFCATCGISMVHQTHNLVDGPRPPLGVMVVDDGSSYVLDSDYIVGRDPSQASEVVSGDARSIVLPDVKKAISRVHARVHLDGWDVTVSDAGSANGTFVAQPGDQAWTRVGDSPTPITPGATVRVGHRTMMFDSHRRRG